MKIHNSTKGTLVASDCGIADNFFTRFKGLMLRKSLDSGSGLLITPCNSIHMFFMNFPIDAVFLDRSNTIVYMAENIKPWRISRVVFNARSVLELPAGTTRLADMQPGDKLDMTGS